MSDPTLDAALEYVRSFQKKPQSLLGRLWNWYRRVTGYEKAVTDRLWPEAPEASQGGGEMSADTTCALALAILLLLATNTQNTQEDDK